MSTRSIIVWGTSSGAGKSFVATALCRWAARQGLNVAPFKAQNMSNNARVVPCADGGHGEIGAAQYFQALAARVAPHVDMNPVLLKPESDQRSQVVVHGRVRADLAALPWRERSPQLAELAHESFDRLARRHDLLVIEGAGSPAEINLADIDYVNLHTARWAQACGPTAALLVTDIDRGGAFAHVAGTVALLPEDLRPLLAGYVLNRFRGDQALLAPGPAMLQQRTGVPLGGVLPMLRSHGLPEEDGVFDASPRGAGVDVQCRIAVIAPPHISNLDEFAPLARVAGVRLSWARQPVDVEGVDWIVQPGSKQVSGDLAWMQSTGLAQAVQRHAAHGGAVLGICGGLQMLGQRLDDPLGFDGQAVSAMPALQLLPLFTHYAAAKRISPLQADFRGLVGPWAALNGVHFTGYQIRHGVSLAKAPCAVLHDTRGEALGWQQGSVLGVYVHGLFESPAVLRALFGAGVPTLDDSFDTLADLVQQHLDPALLQRITGGDRA